MHYKNSYEDDIEPNAEQIIQNEKDGHQTFIYKLLLARTDDKFLSDLVVCNHMNIFSPQWHCSLLTHIISCA